MTETNQSRKEQRDKWLLKMNEAEKKFADYYALINEIRQYYRNDRQKNKQNIFWASVETLKPFLYFKQPHPFVVRAGKNNDETESLACRILERALNWDLIHFSFYSAVKYARNDFLISGMGILLEQYVPTFKYVGTD
ncbi:MAG: hypothetical protein IJ824_00320, partial [Alphaproteobacteria bacterium]|nr:hypothetical protein [Alphaproteobacteria bacterium]